MFFALMENFALKLLKKLKFLQRELMEIMQIDVIVFIVL